MAVVYSDQVQVVNGKVVLQSGDRFLHRSPLEATVVIPRASGGNAFTCDGAASGHVRIEGHDWAQDGIRVGATKGTGACVYTGFMEIHDRVPADTHQDGLQAGGGSNVLFKRFVFKTNVQSSQGALFQGYSGGRPTDIVLEECVVGNGFANSVVIGDNSVRCGIRGCLISRGTQLNIRVKDTASSPVNTGNKLVTATDAVLQACLAALSVEPWLGGTEPPPPPPPDEPPPPPSDPCADVKAQLAAALAERDALAEKIVAAKNALG